MKLFLRWLFFGLECKRCHEVSRDVNRVDMLCLTCTYVEAIMQVFGRKEMKTAEEIKAQIKQLEEEPDDQRRKDSRS